MTKRRLIVDDAIERLEWVEPPQDLGARIMQAVEREPLPALRQGAAAAAPARDAAAPVREDAAVRDAAAPWAPAIEPRRALAAIVAAEGASLATLAGIAILLGGPTMLRGVAGWAQSLLALTGDAWAVAHFARAAVASAPWLGAVLVLPVVAAAVLLGRSWMNAETLEEGVL